MKKSIIALFLFCSVSMAFAQIPSQNALGLRLGWGAEISYQRQTVANQRVEADLGVFKSGFNIAGVYHWVVDLSAMSNGFNMYVGPGATIGFWKDGFAFGALAQLGLEYNIPNSPVQFSLDYRPGFYLSPEYKVDPESVGLGIRFLF